MRLHRFKSNGSYVLGVLKDDKGGTYFTCENAAKAVPDGVYRVIVNLSPRFNKRLPLLVSDAVPAARGIRIHTGNTWMDSNGCILVGNGCSLSTGRLTDSAKAMEQLMEAVGERLEIATL
ncbi:MAG: hypothetical protein HUK21_13070 [Fibrobacteraceae bacterium]|nr:hypothetical protein [Fibrobacteraceae bacterium]